MGTTKTFVKRINIDVTRDKGKSQSCKSFVSPSLTLKPQFGYDYNSFNLLQRRHKISKKAEIRVFRRSLIREFEY
jgi:hypothetical protein